MSYLKILVEELADQSINEVLGKFDLNYFKKLSASSVRPETKEEEEDFAWKGQSHPEVAYAKSMLPELGQGSSRVALALSGGKVLKIAINKKGFQQNKAEVDTFQRGTNIDLITKIYDFAPDYKWVISEIVKEIPPEQFEQFSGVPAEDMPFFASLKSLQGAKDRATDLTAAKTNPKVSRNFDQKFQWKIDAIEALFKNPRGLQFMESIWALIKTHGLHYGDIVPEHFGRTVDGQLRLFDYGLTEKMYAGWMAH